MLDEKNQNNSQNKKEGADGFENNANQEPSVHEEAESVVQSETVVHEDAESAVHSEAEVCEEAESTVQSEAVTQKETESSAQPEETAQTKRSETESWEDTKKTGCASHVEYGPDFYRSNAAAYAKMKETRSNFRIVALIVAVSVIIVALTGIGSFLVGKTFLELIWNDDQTPSENAGSNEQGTHVSDSVIIYQTDENASQTDGSVASVAAKSASSVVEIMTQTESAQYPNKTVVGAGSGVIFAESSDKNFTYIITNNHVVEGYDTIMVRTTDGAQYSATLIGTDWLTDIAVLRIQARGLNKAQFANSDSLMLGQDVVAIGNPLGSLGGSVSRGIISGLSRTISIEGIPMTLLQTDAAINPGNSGGGLFDMNGNLIGIVNAKSVGENVDNIGFAIPGNTAKKVAADLIQSGYVSGRADLGFSFSTATTNNGLTVYSYAYNDELSTPIESGYILYSVTVNDKVIQLNSVDDYRGALAMLQIGQTVQATVYRPVSTGIFTQYKSFTVTLTVHEYTP